MSVNLLDDILVHGKDRDEHDKPLRAALQRLSNHHATVNADKTVLRADPVDFDGLHFSADGVRPIHSHTMAIHDTKPPSNAKMLRSWLGVPANTYGLFPTMRIWWSRYVNSFIRILLCVVT